MIAWDMGHPAGCRHHGKRLVNVARGFHVRPRLVVRTAEDR